MIKITFSRGHRVVKVVGERLGDTIRLDASTHERVLALAQDIFDAVVPNHGEQAVGLVTIKTWPRAILLGEET